MSEDRNSGESVAMERIDQPQRAISAFTSEENFEAAKRMAMVFTTSSLAPEAYRGEKGVANTLIAMELANRIGASPLMVMQNLHIVKGKPGWASSFLIATVNASGRFTPLRFKFTGQEGQDDWGCRAVAKDIESEEECEGALINIKMAKDEGWYGKSGSKWKTMPEQMLMYRAAAFWTRVYAPEMSLGIHTADEMRDIGAGGTRSSGAADLNAALADEGIQTAEVVDEETGEISEVEEVETEEVTEEDDGSPPTEDQVHKLEALTLKAQDAGVLPYEEMQDLQVAIADADGTTVRKGITDLQRRLLELEN